MKLATRQEILLWAGLFPLVVCLTGCVTIKVPFDAPVPNPTPVSKLGFAYVSNFASNTVSMFAVSAAGLWTPTNPSSISTGNLGVSLVVDPSGQYVYVPNAADNTISMFAINLTNGLLTPMSPSTVPTGDLPQFIAVDPKGRFAYTANTLDNTVSMFTIGAGGALIPANPASVHAGENPGEGPAGVTVDPTGRFVYTSNYSGSLSMFAIAQQTGVLTPIGPGEIPASGFPFYPVVESTGRFAYVPNNAVNEIEIFNIDQTTGMLTNTIQSSVPVGQGPTSVGIDPSSRFAYVVNRNSGTISQFNLDSTDGSLTPMSTPVVLDPGEPFQILIDPSGQLAYVSNENINDVTIYSIGADGGLNLYDTVGTDQGPSGIGIAVRR